MLKQIRIWIRSRYFYVVNSIAFYPAFISILFLLVSSAAIAFDYSASGKAFKAGQDWLILRDASTARSIISAIAAGVISLTVFSFSMVMIVLSQAAAQMSNRILDNIIGNKFQQFVLGIYIGTIMFSLFLLSTISDSGDGISVPSISTYLLILITVIDIFIFIYFLHYITQTIKYDVIIRKIYYETDLTMKNNCVLENEIITPLTLQKGYIVNSPCSGYYEGFDKQSLLELCEEQDLVIDMLHCPGSYILKGTSVISLNKNVTDKIKQKIFKSLLISETETIDNNFYYGFRQLTEAAIKALSPGINDPGTAIICIRALFRLFSYRVQYFPNPIFVKNDVTRIITSEWNFEEIFTNSIEPIWDYGKKDRMLLNELTRLLGQLQTIKFNSRVNEFMQTVNTYTDKGEPKS